VVDDGAKTLLLAFGANMPFAGKSPENIIFLALTDICSSSLEIVSVSPLYRTPCFPAGAGPDYVNAAAKVTLRQALSFDSILCLLHAIERRYGRERSLRWGGRTLDIDLLAIDDQILPDRVTQAGWMDLPADRQRLEAPSQLILPHPRLQDRAFVLIPLADVAPDWCHPVLGRTVLQMRDSLPALDRAGVVALSGTDAGPWVPKQR
jgi:2-amino-4-hydroxy-6-hydroxymethyldihydropteridine diphosphokinase